MVARKAGLALRKLARAGDYDVHYLRTKALAETGGLYFSAGIHGDEPASTEALITWAEKNVRRLPKLPMLLLPCLNPWGLVRNVRTNESGLDLNRSFHHEEQPVIHAVKTLVAPYRFSAATMIHEDYDGQGLYLYDIARGNSHWGAQLLEAARKHIPVDPRVRIDGRKVVNGIYRRRIEMKRFKKMGYPEAIWLYLEHADRAMTVETPSEFGLEERVRAHMAVIEEVVRLAAMGR